MKTWQVGLLICAGAPLALCTGLLVLGGVYIAVKAPRKAADAGALTWTPSRDVGQLVALSRDQEGMPGGIYDKTGQKLHIWNWSDFAGFKSVTYARFKEKPEAWKVQVSGGNCSPERFTPEVFTISRGSGEPFVPSWYELRGGPFDRGCGAHRHPRARAHPRRFRRPARLPLTSGRVRFGNGSASGGVNG